MNSVQNISWQGNASGFGTSYINKSAAASFDPKAITLWLSVYESLCFLSTLSNLLVIVLILGNRKLRTACGVLIVHSLITHTALCAVIYPVQSMLTGLKQLAHVSMNPQYCDLIMWFQMTCRYAGSFVETYIAMNRVVAVCWPYKYRSFASLRMENGVVTGCWVGSAVLASLGCFNLGADYIIVPAGSCTIIRLGQYGEIYYVLGYYLPFALTGVGYVVVNLKVLFTRRRRTMEVSSATGNAQQLKVGKRRLNTANMMFVSYIWNLMFYLFAPIVINVAPWLYAMQPMLFNWLGVLQLLGLAIEPMIFFAMSKDYRAEFSRTIKKLLLHGRCSTSDRGIDRPQDWNSHPKTLGSQEHS